MIGRPKRSATARVTLLATRRVFVLVALLCVYSPSYSEPAEPPPSFHTPSRDSIRYLESFDYPLQVGAFPNTWEARRKGVFKARSNEIYYHLKRAEPEGNLYLAAETFGEAIDAGRLAEINLRVYEKVRWRWRVWNLPEGGNEEDKKLNDSAAAVRLVFYGGIRPRMLKYVWSTTLPAKTETESAGNKKIKVVVLRSGIKQTGRWVWEEVNAYKDYKRLFGGEPRPVRIIGVISDGNNTKSHVKADYDDFAFIKAPPDSTNLKPSEGKNGDE